MARLALNPTGKEDKPCSFKQSSKVFNTVWNLQWDVQKHCGQIDLLDIIHHFTKESSVTTVAIIFIVVVAKAHDARSDGEDGRHGDDETAKDEAVEELEVRVEQGVDEGNAAEPPGDPITSSVTGLGVHIQGWRKYNKLVTYVLWVGVC